MKISTIEELVRGARNGTVTPMESAYKDGQVHFMYISSRQSSEQTARIQRASADLGNAAHSLGLDYRIDFVETILGIWTGKDLDKYGIGKRREHVTLPDLRAIDYSPEDLETLKRVRNDLFAGLHELEGNRRLMVTSSEHDDGTTARDLQLDPRVSFTARFGHDIQQGETWEDLRIWVEPFEYIHQHFDSGGSGYLLEIIGPKKIVDKYITAIGRETKHELKVHKFDREEFSRRTRYYIHDTICRGLHRP
jgi:hypothetical protein